MYIEVTFPIDHFLHLTGVATDLSAKSFYKNAKNCILTKDQFYFDTNHTYANAKRKLKYLERLDSLTNQLVCVLIYIETKTVIYKLSVSNFDFTLCLVDGFDKNEELKNSLKRSKDGYFVDFILSKRAGKDKYKFLEYKDSFKILPNFICEKIDKDIL